ncbi:three-helix bundle dimerization domain-containing protein [Microlunatus sp. GCM10028923]|uniref:arsenate reductase/protein-tyrosine-phosphatase family protein n=1 Tax=Microlunatus sp. GCM10028923 TaxID=3273400 RepID=UPI00361BFBCE
MSEPPRSFGTPLDPQSATDRARQIGALAEPDRLRVLSALASVPGAVSDAKRLGLLVGLEASVVDRHLAVLSGVGLVAETDQNADLFRPTADSWARFGRLLGTPSVPDHAEPDGDGGPAPSWTDMPPVIQRIADRLAYRFSTTFSKETVQRYVAESYQLLRDRARVTQHLPSLTSRFAGDRLSALAVARGYDGTGIPEVLFICVQNAGRSQMAAALLRQLAGPRVHVRTAGSRPAGVVDETVVAALDEAGIPMAAEFPKPLTDEVVRAADVIVTMGCGDACPIYPGRRYMDWPTADPVGRPIEEVRAIRDEIQGRVVELLDELGFPVAPRA